MVFITVVAGCTPNAISFNNNDDKKKNKDNQLLLGLLVLSQDQVITSYTGSMNNAQMGHTATLLNNGKVLIVGNGVELYDPDTGIFSVVEEYSISSSVHSHESVLLNNGKVLIAGGLDSALGGNLILDAELYDPDTGKFSSTGSLNVATTIDRGILLDNGKVLMSGTLELYDPDTGTFAKSSVERRYYALALLNDGTILLHGLASLSDAKYQLFIYDPNTDTLLGTNQYTDTNYFNGVVKLNSGKIFLPGGTYQSGFGSDIVFDVHKNIEMYDPDKKRLSYIGKMKEPRIGHTVTVLKDGRVLITGGVSKNTYSSSEFLSSAEIYSP
ncbi:MAG: hypothetical protein H7A23_03380 [Leptospiraceae bacterium]|nr:hypothetical protein [Leptospiraceae bacterium]